MATTLLVLACIVELSIASNLGPSNLGTRDIVSISKRPTVLFGGSFPAFRGGSDQGGEERKREGEGRERRGRNT